LPRGRIWFGNGIERGDGIGAKTKQQHRPRS
jgi:hypothetical protein